MGVFDNLKVMIEHAEDLNDLKRLMLVLVDYLDQVDGVVMTLAPLADEMERRAAQSSQTAPGGKSGFGSLPNFESPSLGGFPGGFAPPGFDPDDPSTWR